MLIMKREEGRENFSCGDASMSYVDYEERVREGEFLHAVMLP